MGKWPAYAQWLPKRKSLWNPTLLLVDHQAGPQEGRTFYYLEGVVGGILRSVQEACKVEMKKEGGEIPLRGEDGERVGTSIFRDRKVYVIHFMYQ